jgi:hypothetical protein
MGAKVEQSSRIVKEGRRRRCDAWPLRDLVAVASIRHALARAVIQALPGGRPAQSGQTLPLSPDIPHPYPPRR